MTGDQLKEWQKQMNLTRINAAELLEISYQHYCKLAQGKTPIKRHMAAACAYHTLHDLLVKMAKIANVK